MTVVFISDSHATTITGPGSGTIEIQGKFSTLHISDEQLTAYINDQLSVDEETGARGAVGVRPIELAIDLLKTKLLTTYVDFDKPIARAIEDTLWPVIRPRLPT